MRKAERILSAALACIMTISGLAVDAFSAEENVCASSASSHALWADGNPNVKSSDQNSIDVIKWFSESDKGKNDVDLGSDSNHYYLLMPTTADLNNLTMWHTFSSNPKIGGVEIQNGKASSAIHGTGDYTMTADGKNYTLTVMQSQSIGSMYIATESGNMKFVHEKKDNKEAGNILVVEKDGKESYNGALSQIKGRGNTTWSNIEKKPYNIKLDKKAPLLGMDESKKWCLLANGQDHTELRNKIAFDLADEIGLDYSPNSEYVDLYLNGEYSGIYQVSQKVEEGKSNLVKINDLTNQTEKLNDKDLDKYSHHSTSHVKYYDIPNNPEDITGGYLMEWEIDDKYNGEPSGFVTDRNQHVVVKGPECASKEQIQYISKFVQEMEDAVYSADGKNSLGKHYTDYLDIESAALMYLMEEFSVDIDCGITSCFFYKDSDLIGDGKIHAAPVWDFDVAFGNLTNHKDGVSMMDSGKWFASKTYRYDGKPTIFNKLFEQSDFVKEVQKQYTEKFKPAVDILKGDENASSGRLKSLLGYRNIIQSSVDMNFVRWNIKENRLVDDEGSSYSSQFTYLSNFVSKRAAFFESNISKLKSYDPTNTKFVIYFKNLLNWDEVYVHYWGGNGSSNWPGHKMTSIGNGIYKYDLGAEGQKDNGTLQMVFNNGYGNGQQTYDVYAVGDYLFVPNTTYSETKRDEEALKYYYTVDMYLYDKDNIPDLPDPVPHPDPDPDPKPVSDGFNIYFKNVHNWDNVYIHYWGGNGNSDWPGIKMTDIGDGIFKFDLKTAGQVDNGNVKIVINNGSGNGKQTKDLQAKSGILYTPGEEPIDEKQDAEAYKYYYSCTESTYTEKQPDPDPKKPIGILGDVDGDGKISSADSLTVLRASVELEHFTEKQTKLGDIDADGNISSGDALYILRGSVGIKSEFSVGEEIF